MTLWIVRKEEGREEDIKEKREIRGGKEKEVGCMR